MLMVIKTLITFFLLVTQAFSAEEIKRHLQTLENINKGTQLCEGKDECSYVLKGLVAVDKKDEFFGLLKNRYEICTRYIEKDKNSKVFKTPYDLSQNLAQYQVKNSISADSEVIDRCLSNDDVRSKEAVSKYYYYVNRLQMGQSSDLEEIADIDRLINKTGVLPDIDCKTIPFEGNKKRCQELKIQCPPGSGLDDLAREAENDLKVVEGLKADIAKIKKDLFAQKAKGKISNLKENVEIIHAKKFQIDLVMSSNPILKGEVFQKENKSNVKEAVKRQLEANRKELLNHFVETYQNHRCLTGTIVTRSCSADKVRDFIETKTPRIVQSFDVLKGKTREEALAGSDYLSFQMCLHDAKVDQLKTDDELSGAVLSAAIGLATVGVGTVFSVGKAVQTARQLQLVKVAQGFVKGVDGAYFAAAVADAGQACLSSKNELQGELKAQGTSCQTNSSFSTRSAVKAHDSCIMKLVMAGLSGLPLAAGAIQKAAQTANLSKTEKLLLKEGVSKEAQQKVVMANAALDDTARAQKIAKDFKNLSKDQIDCVVKKAHTIGKGKGVYQYSQAEIIQKGKTLRKICQVGVDDMRALLQLGYAGDVPTTMAVSDFEKLLERTVAHHAASSTAAVVPVKSLDELKLELSSATDALKRVELKDKIRDLEREMIEEALKNNPKILDDVLAATDKLQRPVTSAPARIGNANALKLSPEKATQLEKAGVSPFEQMLIEVKPGDTIYFKSFSFGNGIGKIKGVDSSQPGHVLVDINGRSVSMSQMDIAMTDKEKAEAFSLMISSNERDGKKIFDEMLKQESTTQQLSSKVIQDLANDVSRSPKKIEADSILERMRDIEIGNRGDRMKTMMDSEYNTLGKKYKELTSVSPEEDRILRALNEIDLTKPKASSADLKVIADAKKIRDRKSEVDLSPEVKNQLKRIDEVEKLVAAAPEKFVGRQMASLQSLNGSSSFGRRYDYPSQANFQKSFAPNSTSLSMYEKQDYKAMEKLFTEDPRLISDESRKWLMGSGSQFLTKHAKPGVESDAGKDYFLKRLKIYLDVYRAQ
jgi:DNA-binding transcriptional MerR regulator